MGVQIGTTPSPPIFGTRQKCGNMDLAVAVIKHRLYRSSSGSGRSGGGSSSGGSVWGCEGVVIGICYYISMCVLYRKPS